jgi:hypothetical protein
LANSACVDETFAAADIIIAGTNGAASFDLHQATIAHRRDCIASPLVRPPRTRPLVGSATSMLTRSPPVLTDHIAAAERADALLEHAVVDPPRALPVGNLSKTKFALSEPTFFSHSMKS